METTSGVVVEVTVAVDCGELWLQCDQQNWGHVHLVAATLQHIFPLDWGHSPIRH